MIHSRLTVIAILLVLLSNSCSEKAPVNTPSPQPQTDQSTPTPPPHEYGGWYCPDNLAVFPAVDLSNWDQVPTIQGRLPTREETYQGKSLIYVDLEQHPDAKPLDCPLPQLGKFFNFNSKKDEWVIVIQAIEVAGDSVVGFRYLNGGNGSARLSEIQFSDHLETHELPGSRFFSSNITISSKATDIWEVLTSSTYWSPLRPLFDPQGVFPYASDQHTILNFQYLNNRFITAEFGGRLFGNYYIQRDYEMADYQYVEKVLLLEDSIGSTTNMTLTFGPYMKDFAMQKTRLNEWAEQVKLLSENR